MAWMEILTLRAKRKTPLKNEPKIGARAHPKVKSFGGILELSDSWREMSDHAGLSSVKERETNHDSLQGYHKPNQVVQLQWVSEALVQPLGLSYIVERIGNQNERMREEPGFAYMLERMVRWNHREQRTKKLGHEEQEGYGYGRDKPLFATQSEHHLASEGIDAKCIVQH